MKRIWFFLAALLLLPGCGRLEKLTWDMTPEKWLGTHSYVPVKAWSLNFILAEPSSTVIVYGLGLVILAAAVRFLRQRSGSRSGFLWSMALFMWALSTFAAGTSYQAFSYEIKCAGRAVCLWTSWWEIWYLILFVANMNLTTAAVAFSSATGKVRKGVIIYSIFNSVVYTAVVLAGALVPHQFMASFECMVLFTMPSFIILLSVNISRYIKLRKKLDILLAGAWIFMFAIVFAYFAFFLSGIADQLWAKGVWFNANDVLHIGLILWVAYLVFAVADKVEDAV